MTLEEMTVEQLNQQIKKEEKELKEKKQQLLAKKVLVKTLARSAEKNKLALPNKFFRTFQRKITGSLADTAMMVGNKFSTIAWNAGFAVENPEGYVAEKLLHKACKLLAKAQKIQDNTHKKAQKIALMCAEMTTQVEDVLEWPAVEDDLRDSLEEIAKELDTHVQRLRTTPKLDAQEIEQKLGEIKC